MAFLLELPSLAHNLLRIQERQTEVRQFLRPVQIQTLKQKLQIGREKSYSFSPSE